MPGVTGPTETSCGMPGLTHGPVAWTATARRLGGTPRVAPPRSPKVPPNGEARGTLPALVWPARRRFP
eukprot:11069834-Lingulodinium_polyedra.AAC.1